MQQPQTTTEEAQPSPAKKTPFYLQERRLIAISIVLAATEILLFWGHRLPVVSLLAGPIASIQHATESFTGNWLLRCYFLLPCVTAGWLTVRMAVHYRRLNTLNAALLVLNIFLAAHCGACLMVLLAFDTR